MAKDARAGELRTKIVVQEAETGVNSNGIEGEAWRDAATLYCKWVNAYGKEVFDAKQAGLSEFATLTMRYTDKVTPTCRVFKGSDPRPYEIISVNDVEDRHVWLEVKVHRKVRAK